MPGDAFLFKQEPDLSGGRIVDEVLVEAVFLGGEEGHARTLRQGAVNGEVSESVESLDLHEDGADGL